MDDAHVVYGTPERVDATLAELKQLGVDRVRVSVYWNLIAPSAQSKQRPAFGAGGPADHRAYPEAHWDRYDRIVRLARAHGLELLFDLTGPAPLWATGRPERRDIEATYEPRAADFRDFAAAVGSRYSGHARDQEGELPRVDSWSIWNEPNHPGWLTPQWLPDPRGGHLPLVPASPRIYRDLADAGVAGLEAGGHGTDTILLGETSPRGHRLQGLTRAIRPLEFIREMYCLDEDFDPFQGEEATIRGCPGSRAAFATDHPALFRASGWAHHPYALESRPSSSARHRDDVVLADIRRLTRTLDRIHSAHGRPARLPVWLTEYGYQTDPPDPTIGVSWARQAAYLNQAEFLAYRNGRIASTAQFLLFDDAPLREFAADDPRHWGTFQSGLKTADGWPKRAYFAFQSPIHVSPSRTRAGRRVRILSQLRGAPDGAALRGRLQRRPARGRARWRTIQRFTTTNPRGYASLKVRVRRSGRFRVVWTDPRTGEALVTRQVRVSVRKKPRRRS